jgi:putative Mn2+ efflux pump MntP
MSLLAVGLAMDATAAAAARGLAAAEVRARDVALVALLFGGFQAAMPLLGFWLGASLGPWVQAVDHWVVFVLLSALGAHMLYEAGSGGADADVADDEKADVFDLRVLLMLSVATSIDAFAVGIALPLLGLPLLPALSIIFVVTAVLSALGVVLGQRFGAALGSKLEVVGGLTLIALGAKTLLEHLLGST